MNVPKIRFNDFYDNISKISIKELGNVITGTTPSTADRSNYGDEYLWASPVDMGDFKYINNTKTKLSEKGFNKTRCVPKDSILITCIGSTIGKTGMASKEMSTNQQINTLIPNKNYNSDYLYYCINFNFPRFLNKISFQAVPIISKSEFEKLEVNITKNIYEQEKIGNMLSLIDKKTELQSKKIEDLKLFKKGLFNGLNFNNSKNIKLSDILKEASVKSTINNQYEILSSTANGLYLQKEYFNKQAASENNIGYKILKRNQLVLSPQNLWMGNININDKYDIGIVSPSYKIFDIDDSIINIDFFNNWIKSPRALYDYMISSEQGASIVRRNLNIDLFNEITIKVPEKNIQGIIGKQIKNINKKIDLENRKLDKLNNLKKGLMQNMFV